MNGRRKFENLPILFFGEVKPANQGDYHKKRVKRKRKKDGRTCKIPKSNQKRHTGAQQGRDWGKFFKFDCIKKKTQKKA